MYHIYSINKNAIPSLRGRAMVRGGGGGGGWARKGCI